MPRTLINFRSFVFGLCLVTAVATDVTASAQVDSARDSNVIGRRIGALAGDDVRGGKFDLQSVAASQLVAVAFLGTECPLARKYSTRLGELANEYRDRVQFVGVFSNRQDSEDEIAAYAIQVSLAFPAIQDKDNQIADQFSARRTPEVYLLDAERKIRYRGRIDDQFGIGIAKPEPTERNLASAIEHLCGNASVPVPETEPVGCLIGRVQQSPPSQNITYATHIAPILNRHCIACHQPGQIGPMSLTQVEDVLGWAAMIDEVVRQERMPPWHADRTIGTFSNARGLSEEEKLTLSDWVAIGSPIGDQDEIPPVPTAASGWQLPREPDLVIPVSAQPIEIPASGELDYRHFSSEYVFPDETWVQAAQILPGNHSVVHHILAFCEGPRGRQAIGALDGIDGFLAAYVPGLIAEPFPEGSAKRIPAGSRLIFQVHYTPNGTPQTDCSRIGLIFADSKTVRREIVSSSAIRRQLEIPPGVSDHQVTAFSHRPLEGAMLLGMMPHMHLRGKSFRFQLQSADGSVRNLLNVPRYDFHWQSSYRLAEPILLHAGDRICCLAQFDNSRENLNNPDPTQTIRWGDQTREEMMIGYFDIAVERNDEPIDPLDLDRHIALVRSFDRFDRNLDGVWTREEIPESAAARFQVLDCNADSQVTFAEMAARRGGEK